VSDQTAGHDEVEVAHEALIRHWPRLRTWLDEDRASLLQHESLREAAQDWDRHGREESYLAHRGQRLINAEALAHHPRYPLNAQEQAYLDAAIDFREREDQERLTAFAAREQLRRRILFGLAAFSAAALILALIAGWQWQAAQREATVARNAEATAVAEAQIALSRQLAAQSLHVNEVDLGLLLSAEASRLNPGDLEIHRSLLAAVHEQPRLKKNLRAHQGTVHSLSYSPNDSVLVSGGADGLIRRWDVVTGTLAAPPLESRLFHVASDVYDIEFRPDGGQIASTSGYPIRLWDPLTGEENGPALPSTSISLAFSPNGKVLASAGEAVIEFWDPVSGAQLGEVATEHGLYPVFLDFNANGSILASAGTSEDGTVWFWDPATAERSGEPIATEQGAFYAGPRFSPDGTILATGGEDGTIRFWDVATRLPIGAPLDAHSEAVTSLVFSRDGRVLASAGGSDSTIREWDVATHQPIGPPIESGQGLVSSLAMSPDGQTLASGGEDGTIRLWERAAIGNSFFAPVNGHREVPLAIAFSPDGSTVATGGYDNAVALWDARNGFQIGSPLQGHADAVSALDFSPNTALLASASYDGTIRLWDVATRQAIWPPIVGHREAVNSLAFSPAGDLLASGGDDGTIHIWRVTDAVADGPPINADLGFVLSVVFSPDGSVIAAAGQNGIIRFWDLVSRQPVGPPITTGQGAVQAIRFVRQGTGLASAGEDGTIKYWSMPEGSAVGDAVSAHEGAIARLVTNRNGSLLASAGADGSVRLWEIGRTTPKAEPLAPGATAWQEVAFNPDGSQLAFTSGAEQTNDLAMNIWAVGKAESLLAFPIFENLNDVTLTESGSSIVAGGKDGRVFVWDADTGNLVAEQRITEEGGIHEVVVTPDGSLIAIGGLRNIYFWDLGSGQPIGPPIASHAGPITTLVFNHDATLLASGGDDGTIRVWDVEAQEPIGRPFIYEARLSGNPERVEAVAFSPDGSLLAAAGREAITIWDVANGQRVGDPIEGSTINVSAMAFSPDGRVLATAEILGGEVRVWDADSRQPAGKSLLVPDETVDVIAFNATGSQLATGSTSGSTRIWDLATGSILADLGSTSASVLAVAYSADGGWLTAVDAEGIVSRWAISEEMLTRQACAVANRNLTREEWRRYVGDPDSATFPYHKTCPDNQEADASVLATPIAMGGVVLPSPGGGSSAELQDTDAATPDPDTRTSPTDYAQVVQSAIGTIDHELNDEICRDGSLDGFAEVVLPSCDRAVELAPGNELYAHSRGMARALTGDYPGAIEDFERFLTWAREAGMQDWLIRESEAWIAELREGRNPIDAETIQELQRRLLAGSANTGTPSAQSVPAAVIAPSPAP
jgi:WD40 repeat protein